MQHFLILGSHPALSLAEARSVLGDPAPICVNDMAIFDRLSWKGEELQTRLAGVTKLGDIVADLPVKDVNAEYLAGLLLENFPRPPGKTVYAISFFGEERDIKPFKHLPIELKRQFQEKGQKVRWFAGEYGEVSPAAVAKLHLTDEGYDICIAVHKNHAWIGLTTHVQNADTWSQRDFSRPFRDRKVGMLPPKLARLMVNLSQLDLEKAGPTGEAATTLLDPFCGGGTILMEAALLGFRHLIGSDIDSTQIQGSKQNMEWLMQEGWITKEEHDSTKMFVSPVESVDQHVSPGIGRIVTEGYLGKPLRGDEPIAFLEDQQKEIENLWSRALPVLARLQPAGGTLVGIWPMFKTEQGMIAVDATQAAQATGYEVLEPLQGWFSEQVDLVYARLDQHVQRRIVVLRKMGG